MEKVKVVDNLERLKDLLKEKIKELDKRIEVRDCPCYFDETKTIERFHSEAYAYENVLKFISDIEKGVNADV